MDWKQTAINYISESKQRVVTLNPDTGLIKYSAQLKSFRDIDEITGDEEIARACLVTRLVNELDYRPECIELEKGYEAGRPKKITPRIDVIVRDAHGNAFFFIEAKSPYKFESDKDFIEGQLFKLARLEGNVRYLVYYTLEEFEGGLRDKAIVIDFTRHNDFAEWINAGAPSITDELPAHYEKPKKTPLIKGSARDLKKEFQPAEFKALATDLHNVLWGGGGTGDTEVFTSLVNVILAKIQDEYDCNDGEEYQFQIFQFGDDTEPATRVFERINTLYRKALKLQLNITDDLEHQFVINQQKFPLNKLIYTVQSLEDYSFIDGRSTLDGKDILGDFFEQIQREGFKQTKGQFFTPTNVVRFLLYSLEIDNLALSRLNNDRQLPYIIDPACGSGSFLIEAMKIITQELKRRRRKEIRSSRQVQDKFDDFFMPDHKEHRWAREFIYGVEINFDLGTATKVNMILHGDGATNIFVKDGLLPFRFYEKATAPNALKIHEPDALYYDKDVNGEFDVVVSNPPFSVNLDTETKRFLSFGFIFHAKKNSENLYIERYYQLLKPNGRLGVVLPESVFDTTENKYIRLFLYKYFHVRALVSMPQLTFEPYTSTKTSLLLAQKKTPEEVKEWTEIWNRCSADFSRLKTRAENYIKVYLEGEPKSRFPSIRNDNPKAIRSNLSEFLSEELPDLESTPIEDVVSQYRSRIEEVARIDNDLSDQFGFVNTSWVFRKVSKALGYRIFMAEASEIGYKRTKRGEKVRENDLFDLEIAPDELDRASVLNEYKTGQDELLHREQKLREELAKGKVSDEKKAILGRRLKLISAKLERLITEKEKVVVGLDTFYEADGKLRSEYKARLNPELLKLFQLPLMKRFSSLAVLIRSSEPKTILDYLRTSKVWR